MKSFLMTLSQLLFVERGILKLKKVKIGKNVTIGSHCTIMPGCEISDRAVIGASAVLMKDTKVAEKEIWFGIPDEAIRTKREISRDDPSGEIKTF